jgi:hypothetical protein
VVSEEWATLDDPPIRLRLGADAEGGLKFCELCLTDETGIGQGLVDGIDIEAIRAVVTKAVESHNARVEAWASKRSYRAKVKVPERRPYGDEFFQRVADVYLGLVSEGCRSPALEIAKASDAEPSSVRGWIQQARQRGYLRAGRQGALGG